MENLQTALIIFGLLIFIFLVIIAWLYVYKRLVRKYDAEALAREYNSHPRCKNCVDYDDKFFVCNAHRFYLGQNASEKVSCSLFKPKSQSND